jgi:hypothetical protein
MRQLWGVSLLCRKEETTQFMSMAWNGMAASKEEAVGLALAEVDEGYSLVRYNADPAPESVIRAAFAALPPQSQAAEPGKVIAIPDEDYRKLAEAERKTWESFQALADAYQKSQAAAVAGTTPHRDTDVPAAAREQDWGEVPPYPADWGPDEGDDYFEARAFYEFCQWYRHSKERPDKSGAAAMFEMLKKYGQKAVRAATLAAVEAETLACLRAAADVPDSDGFIGAPRRPRTGPEVKRDILHALELRILTTPATNNPPK